MAQLRNSTTKSLCFDNASVVGEPTGTSGALHAGEGASMSCISVPLGSVSAAPQDEQGEHSIGEMSVESLSMKQGGGLPSMSAEMQRSA